jgi:Protein of unknown function (DUF3309)
VYATAPKRVNDRRTLQTHGMCRLAAHRRRRIATPDKSFEEEYTMGLGTILLVILILILIGVIPTWPHSRGWGFAPSGIVGLLVVVLLVLLLMGRI